jgi:uncharacterized membrane protein YgcG
MVCLETVLLSCAVAGAAISAPYPQVSRATAENQLRCFMHMPTGSSSLNLESLCGYVPTVAVSAGGGGGGSLSSGTVSSGGGGGGGSSSGPCNVASDRASDGSLCGGRAASERSGGR